MTRIRIRQISSDVDPLPLYLTIMERAEVPPLVLEVMCPPVPDYHGEGRGAPLGPGGYVICAPLYLTIMERAEVPPLVLEVMSAP